MNPSRALMELLAEVGERIAKRWARGATAESGDRVDAYPRGLRRELAGHLDELRRLLETRGSEAPPLWGEAVRHHGGWLLEHGFSAGDLVRHFHALVHAIAEEWRRRDGVPPPAEIVALLGELTTAGAAAAAEDYLRRVRSGRTRVREEGAIESIVAHLDEGLLAFESDGTLSFATPAGARILGVPVDELRGLASRDVPRLARRLALEGADEDPLALRGPMRTRQPARGVIRRFTRPSDRQARIVELSALPVLDEGELRGVVVTLADRTEEVRQREALEAAFEELRRLHLRQLRRTRAQAAGELAGRIGVGVMNALNAARLRCRLLADAGAPAEHVHAIERSIDEVAQVFASLLELGTPRELGAPETVELDAAVGQAVDLVRPELRGPDAPRIDLAVDLASRAHVRARRSDVRELAVHLLLAALDHAAPGAELRLRSEAAGPRARLILDGAGTLPNDALAPVRELAAAWEGEVFREVDAVVVELPTTRASEPRASKTPPPATPARSVLVVDDDADNRQALGEILSAQGFEVTEAGSAAEAEAQARSRPFEVALVDLVMPDASGWEVVRLLHELQPDARVALVTGAGASRSCDPAAEARGFGKVDVVFAKPIDLEALLGFLGRGAHDSLPAHG